MYVRGDGVVLENTPPMTSDTHEGMTSADMGKGAALLVKSGLSKTTCKLWKSFRSQ